MNKTLKILAIDDDPDSVERGSYAPLKRALNYKDIDFEYKIVKNYGEAIDELKNGYRPDAITADYMIKYEYQGISRGAVGHAHLKKVLQHIENNIPDYSPKSFMLTASTNDANIEIRRNSVLSKSGTKTLDKAGMHDVIMYLEDSSYMDDAILEKDSNLSVFLREHLGEKIIPQVGSYNKYKKEEQINVKNTKNSSGILSESDFSDNGYVIKSLLPNIADDEENKTYRVDCLKSNNRPINGYAAFNAEDVDRLRKEGKDPILFIQNYDAKTHASLLTKVAGVVCLGSGGSHLLDMSIPTVGKSDK